jgi:hypothetical protein
MANFSLPYRLTERIYVGWSNISNITEAMCSWIIQRCMHTKQVGELVFISYPGCMDILPASQRENVTCEFHVDAD